jgi:hypothetical protein
MSKELWRQIQKYTRLRLRNGLVDPIFPRAIVDVLSLVPVYPT